MSIFTTIAKDGVSVALKAIPSYYLIGAGVLALGGIIIWGKIWFHNKVEAEAQVIITKYIADKKKDDAALAEIVLKDNTKIQIQYVDKVTVITKVVTVNHDVIVAKVPDTKTILSDGWVSAFNSAAAGLQIDPVAATVATPSGVSAVDALDVTAQNDGICQVNKARLDSLQAWVTNTAAAVAAQNKKDGAK